jgi:4'-phosphopantetheinyl transferase
MSRTNEPAAWAPASTFTGPDAERIDVWRIRLDGEPPLGLLTEDERRRADRLLGADRRRQFASARASLRMLLGRYLERSPEAVELRLGQNGKPELPHDELSFNLSHSGDLALLAVAGAGTALGVDLEEVSTARPLDRMAQRFFSTREAAEYASLPPPERAGAFYRLWTRKEAYLKAWGTGLTFSSRRFTLELGPGPGRLLSSTEMPGDDDPRAWWFEDLDAAPGFVAALCRRGERASIGLFDFPRAGSVA